MATSYQLEIQLVKRGITVSKFSKNHWILPNGFEYNPETGKLRIGPKGKVVEEIRASPERAAEIIAAQVFGGR